MTADDKFEELFPPTNDAGLTLTGPRAEARKAAVEQSKIGNRGIFTFGNGMHYNHPRVWRALTARPSKEQEAADWLRRDKLYCYWPNYIAHVPTSSSINGKRRRRSVLRALIPGYLFLATPDERVEPSLQALVEAVPGLLGFVRDAGSNAASMMDEDIEIIRRLEGSENLPPPAKHVHRFKIGDRVRFVDDLLGRWPAGKIMRFANDGKIEVEVALLGRGANVKSSPQQLVMA